MKEDEAGCQLASGRRQFVEHSGGTFEAVCEVDQLRQGTVQGDPSQPSAAASTAAKGTITNAQANDIDTAALALISSGTCKSSRTTLKGRNSIAVIII